MKDNDRQTQEKRNTWITPRRVLIGGMAFTGVVGIILITWLIDKAIHFPEIQARQFRRFGEQAPLWIPLIIFVLLSFAGIFFLLWRAKQRLDAGEDLFAQRHRRRPSDEHEEPATHDDFEEAR